MKRLLLILILFALVAQPCLAAINTFTQSVDHRKVVRDSYAWTGHAHKDKAWIWAKEVEDRIDGTTYNQSYFLEPTTAPDANEGRFYYDSTSNMLTVYNGSDWITLGTSAGGDSLDTAYNNGSSITVDTAGVTLAVADTAISALIISTENSSDDTDCVTITTSAAGYTGDLLYIDGVTGSYDIRGDNWVVDNTGLFTCIGVTSTGTLTLSAADVLFDATDTGKDLEWDDSQEALHFLDNCILAIGGTTTAVGDLTITGTGTNVNVEVASEDGADLIFGATNALDILIHNDQANALITFDQSEELLAINGWDVRVMDDDDIVFGDDVASDSFTVGFDESTDNLIMHATTASDKVQIGDGTTDTDFKLMTNTATTFVLWSAVADEMIFDYADLKINDQSQIEFANSSDVVEWSIDCVTGERLLFYPTQITDDQAIHFGTADNTSDIGIFGITASTVLFDASGNEAIFDAYDLRLNDNDILGFGDSNDFTITSSGATQLDIGSLLTDETAAIDIGASASGIDVNWFELEAGDYVLFDASRGDVLFDDVNVVMKDDTRLQFGDSNDFYITNSSATQLDVVSLLTDETAAIDFGASAAGIDVNLYSGVGGDYILFDASRGDMLFDDCNLVMKDTTFLSFGDVNDFQISSTSATQLDITTPLIATSVIAIDFGVAEAGIDVNLFGEAAGSQMVWDASRAELFFETADVNISDSATLSFGDGVDFIFNSDTDGRFDVQTTATDETPQFCFGYDTVSFDVNFAAALGDDWVRFDASRGDMLFEDVNIVLMDNTYVAFGDVNDFQIRSTSATQLDITTPLIDTSIIAIDFGVDQAGIDVNLFGETAGARVVWDATANELFFETADINVSDSADLIFGDGDDFIIDCDVAARLDIVSAVTDETGQICFGKEGEGIDVNFAGYEAVTWARFDASAEDFIFEDVNVMLMDATKLVFGDSDDFTIASTSATQLDIVSLVDTSVVAIDFGIAQAGIDVNLFGETAGALMVWDASRDELFFETADVNISDSATLIFGDGVDFIINSDVDGRLDIQTTVTDETPQFCFGYDQVGFDVNFAGGLADDWARFDASRGDFLFEDINVVLMDDTYLHFGDVNDFTVKCTSATQLDIGMSLVSDETGAVDFGADQTGIDVNLFGAAAGARFWWDASASELNFETADINVSDTANLQFGDGDDFIIDCDVAARLDIQTTATDESPIICFGFDQAGIDVNFAGYEADTWARFDASAEDFIFEDVNVMLMDNTELIFGDSDDVVADFNSTEGALQVNGFMYGDKKQIEHLTASHTLTAEESGKVFYVSKELAGVASDEVITLPTAEAGLWYIIIDANETADADVTIQTSTDDKINDGAASAKYVHDTDADNYATCYIIAIDAVDWVIISETGTWQNE